MKKRPPMNRLIAITPVSMPLLMPFYFDYDLLLLSAAAKKGSSDAAGRLRQVEASGCP